MGFDQPAVFQMFNIGQLTGDGLPFRAQAHERCFDGGALHLAVGWRQGQMGRCIADRGRLLGVLEVTGLDR